MCVCCTLIIKLVSVCEVCKVCCNAGIWLVTRDRFCRNEKRPYVPRNPSGEDWHTLRSKFTLINLETDTPVSQKWSTLLTSLCVLIYERVRAWSAPHRHIWTKSSLISKMTCYLLLRGHAFIAQEIYWMGVNKCLIYVFCCLRCK